MRFRFGFFVPFFLLFSLSTLHSQSPAQSISTPDFALSSSPDLPDAPTAPILELAKQNNSESFRIPASKQMSAAGKQPARMTGMMPVSRAMSPGAIPRPPTPGQAFMAATHRSFDWSSYALVGITSLSAKGRDTHPSLGKGAPGLWAYYWRGFVDRTDGSYWVIFALPQVFHEDERFHVMQHGRKFYRLAYAASRVLITSSCQRRQTVNISELLGQGASQSISLTYYPESDRTATAFGEKYGHALVSDAATNIFREFWFDIETHVLHRQL